MSIENNDNNKIWACEKTKRDSGRARRERERERKKLALTNERQSLADALAETAHSSSPSSSSSSSTSSSRCTRARSPGVPASWYYTGSFLPGGPVSLSSMIIDWDGRAKGAARAKRYRTSFDEASPTLIVLSTERQVSCDLDWFYSFAANHLGWKARDSLSFFVLLVLSDS